ncbi:AMP-binding protein [Croceicoccus sp. BE223]|uniref:class I adenylate-forming enzyme family protein n=1 Tax=Croceicoccus sp. BE223 TaxID=2817716 RepID=UPI0028643214|nr:AMP-binding protein [Croceicoccus sp. BE223]MDR7103790.1 fatty-acyl-CoA synthase [Croceicoccus sp. BE223]
MTGALPTPGEPAVYDLFAVRARVAPDALAIAQGALRLRYAELLDKVDRFAAGLHARGVKRGDRVAILSENRWEYLALHLACARIGAIAACQNWRLALPELQHCIRLVSPRLVVASDQHRAMADAAAGAVPVCAIEEVPAAGPSPHVGTGDDGLLIIYTSGTTGLPKAALIGQRAEVWRACVLRIDVGLDGSDGYVAWAPMFHMGGTEHSLATLMGGGPVIVTTSFSPAAIVDALEEFRIGWLLLIPATIEPVLEELERRAPVIRGVKVVGCMPDLVPAATIAAITTRLDASYLDSFGATETGMPPLSANLIAPGTAPGRYPKNLSMLTDLRLCDAEGHDVERGQPGEAWLRSPTLFSGYWNNPEANVDAFRDGWYRMGDLFREEDDGFHFVGRAKYLIKSGGENIYPAEIERVLLADPRVIDAIVVRRPDAKWGEVPVAVIARNCDTLDEAAVIAMCRANLAGYKQPRGVRFVNDAEFPRSASGKIMREAVEAMVA